MYYRSWKLRLIEDEWRTHSCTQKMVISQSGTYLDFCIFLVEWVRIIGITARDVPRFADCTVYVELVTFNGQVAALVFIDYRPDDLQVLVVRQSQVVIVLDAAQAELLEIGHIVDVDLCHDLWRVERLWVLCQEKLVKGHLHVGCVACLRDDL